MVSCAGDLQIHGDAAKPKPAHAERPVAPGSDGDPFVVKIQSGERVIRSAIPRRHGLELFCAGVIRAEFVLIFRLRGEGFRRGEVLPEPFHVS